MCGIIGLVAAEEMGIAEPLQFLKRLEYRGYDSFGFATNTDFIEKHVGDIGKFDAGADTDVKSRVFVCHTRWATHGGVTESNAHPHLSCDGKIAVVHNGIIENYQELKRELEVKGHKFVSETDSEVIAHFFEDAVKDGKTIESAVPEFMQKAKGTFAVLIIRKGDDRIYAIKRDSPLVLGLLGDGRGFVLASDIYAFSDKTDRAIFFDDDGFAVVEKDSYRFFDSTGNGIEKEVKQFKWTVGTETKEGFQHFMLKEIMEQSETSERLLGSLETIQKDKMIELKQLVSEARKVVFVCAGTSYHASLFGVYFLKNVGIDAQSIVASEFQNYATIDENTLVIAISQSGETMDVIEALKYVREKGSKIVSLVNVPYSSIQRMSDISLEIMAGQEVCVAATKSFTNQVVLLLCLASLFGHEIGIETISQEIGETIKLNEERVKRLAKELSDDRDIYVIGRGISYPAALETALKIKEVSYIHAEGMMGGELKHGTLALVEKGTPVISIIEAGDNDMFSNTKEAESRGARTIIVSNSTDADLKIPTQQKSNFGILVSIVGQMLAYYIALEKSLPIDKIRNLAKSVTVK